MVVTRQMLRKKLANAKKNAERKIPVRDCFVLLERLTKEDVYAAVHPPTDASVKNNAGNHRLRQRKPKPEKKKTERKQKSSTAIVKATSTSLNHFWKTAKINRTVPKLNTIVLAKMRTFSPWPSKLVSIENNKALVYFFGTNNHGTVPFEDVVPFYETVSVLKILITMKIQFFKKAVREAEIFLGVPPMMSILNENL